MRKYGKGWYRESKRHSLARKGIKTGRKVNYSKELIKGGRADGLSDSGFNMFEVKRGMKVEREHTTSKKIQKEIAKDHLTESPFYYDYLSRMEFKMKHKLNYSKKKEVILIENIRQEAYKFPSISELKRYAEEEGLKIKKSPVSDETYYTEGF